MFTAKRLAPASAPIPTVNTGRAEKIGRDRGRKEKRRQQQQQQHTHTANKLGRFISGTTNGLIAVATEVSVLFFSVLGSKATYIPLISHVTLTAAITTSHTIFRIDSLSPLLLNLVSRCEMVTGETMQQVESGTNTYLRAHVQRAVQPAT